MDASHTYRHVKHEKGMWSQNHVYLSVARRMALESKDLIVSFAFDFKMNSLAFKLHRVVDWKGCPLSKAATRTSPSRSSHRLISFIQALRAELETLRNSRFGARKLKARCAKLPGAIVNWRRMRIQPIKDVLTLLIWDAPVPWPYRQEVRDQTQRNGRRYTSELSQCWRLSILAYRWFDRS